MRERDKLIDVQPASGRAPKDVFGFSQPIEINMVDGKIVIPDPIIRVKFDSFPGFGHRLFVLTSGLVKHPRQQTVGPCVPRVGSRPSLTDLSRCFHVSSHQRLIISSDREPLLVAGASPQLPGFPGAFRGEIGLIDICVHAP